jgi:lysophospholipid acyltransferase (LPLAT)-like uncharacterized protein
MAEPMGELAAWAVSRIGGGVLGALLATSRYAVVEGEREYESSWGARRPAVYVLWHGRLLPTAYFHRHRGLATLISRNRDGEYIADTVRRWGYTIVRGSSSRGGDRALREMLRVLGAGMAIAITPDGPRGPRQKMKVGPLRAAQLAGVPVYPVTAGAASAWHFGRWDRFLVPRPFTRIHIAYGRPLTIPPGAGAEELEGYASELEVRLNDLTRRVDESVGAPSPS